MNTTPLGGIQKTYDTSVLGLKYPGVRVESNTNY
jgi:hypothetical protein